MLKFFESLKTFFQKSFQENKEEKTFQKRIAIVSTSFPPLNNGGIASSHSNLCNVLKEKDYIVRGFTYSDNVTNHSLQEKDIIRRGLPNFLVKAIRRFVFIVFRLIGDNNVVYQFADTLIGSLSGILLIAKIKNFDPHIIVVPDHGAPSAFWPKHKKAKIIFISHHNPARFLDEPLLGLHSYKDAQLGLKLENLALKKVDGVICPSSYMKKMFLETYSFKGPLSIIPNMVNVKLIDQFAKSDLHKKNDLPTNTPIIYIPSAGSIFKGQQFIFEIIRRLSCLYKKKIGFYLSGAINMKLSRSLEFLPKNTHLITPGRTTYAENIANIKSCTFCISPTLIENLSMAILEAQLCGLPVVTFDVGGNKEIVTNEKTGYIVPFMDIEALIDFSYKLLSNEQLIENMGLERKKLLLEKFNSNTVIDKFIDFFESL